MKDVIWISLIGAGFVILGLMMLWFLMSILVRLTSRRQKGKSTESETLNIIQNDNLEPLQKAAAASTAVAIALLRTSFLSSDKKVDQNLTAWQSAHRHQQLHNLPKTTFANRKNK